MNKFQMLMSGFIFLWKNRNNIGNIWEEVVDVREVISVALADKKISKSELKDIIREVHEVLGSMLNIK